MSWIAAGVAGANLVGGVLQGKKNRKAAKKAAKQDREMYEDAKLYNRVNQTNVSGATSTYSQDPLTKAWSQVQKLGPEEQQRRDVYNQIGLGRMQNAAQMKLPDLSQGIDYGAWKMPNYNSPGGNYQAQPQGGAMVGAGNPYADPRKKAMPVGSMGGGLL